METYSVLALSTGHIEESDNVALKAAAYQTNMVMVRDSGYFIKLYQDDKTRNIRPGYSSSLQKLIEFALDKGFEMIELDSDADTLEEFILHDW